MIKIYNSLTKQTEEFIPIKENEVSMYVCGPTVYGSPHIGNSRPLIFFDTVARFFRYRGYKVTYVSNYTDIDDKIIARAKQETVSEEEISEKYINETNELLKNLNCLPYSETMLVTKTIPEIIHFITRIIECGGAYEAAGDVYFNIGSVPEYGVLSGQSVDNLISGARVDANDKKKNPLDFNLWKKTTEGRKWSSPWSEGRPGWHTECVVMIEKIFKGKIDIHGGGNDLKFPHHDNEIAQSLCLNDHMIANYWMHNGMIDFSGAKMSKSLGNFITAKDLLAATSAPVYRLMILNVPYRQPMAFKEEMLEQAENDYQKIKRCYLGVRRALELSGADVKARGNDGLEDIKQAFINAMEQDFNTANALTHVHHLVKEGNMLVRESGKHMTTLAYILELMKEMLWVLGIDIPAEPLSEEFKVMVKEYYRARAAGDYALSDRLRNKIMEKGVII